MTTTRKRVVCTRPSTLAKALSDGSGLMPYASATTLQMLAQHPDLRNRLTLIGATDWRAYKPLHEEAQRRRGKPQAEAGTNIHLAVAALLDGREPEGLDPGLVAVELALENATNKRDLLEHYGDRIGADRVRVIPNGVDLSIFRPDPADKPDETPYLADVGNQDPRKDIGTLLEAFPIFRARLRAFRLVMVGPGRPPAGKPAAVDVLGYLDERALASVYRRAVMVVQPSLYEGFGLPVLEAMACGTPVACADIEVFREVAGDCERYFDPRA